MSVLLRVRTDGPDGPDDSPETHSLNRIIDFDAFAGHMRKYDDVRMPPTDAICDIIDCFEDIDFSGRRARLLGILAPDVFYQGIARIEILDRYTRIHVRTAIRFYFDELRSRGIRSFYVLDNSLRDDRFATFVELFGLAGFAVISPHVQGTDWSGLETCLRANLAAHRHIAYVEKDATVNHLDLVKALAARSDCAAAFRHLAPEKPDVEILGLPPGDDTGRLDIHLFGAGLSREAKIARVREYYAIDDEPER